MKTKAKLITLRKYQQVNTLILYYLLIIKIPAGLIQLYPIISGKISMFLINKKCNLGNSGDDYIPHAIFKNVLECALKLVEGHNQKKLAIDFIEKVFL